MCLVVLCIHHTRKQVAILIKRYRITFCYAKQKCCALLLSNSVSSKGILISLSRLCETSLGAFIGTVQMYILFICTDMCVLYKE